MSSSNTATWSICWYRYQSYTSFSFLACHKLCPCPRHVAQRWVEHLDLDVQYWIQGSILKILTNITQISILINGSSHPRFPHQRRPRVLDDIKPTAAVQFPFFLPARRRCDCQRWSTWPGNDRQGQTTRRWWDLCDRGCSGVKTERLRVRRTERKR